MRPGLVMALSLHACMVHIYIYIYVLCTYYVPIYCMQGCTRTKVKQLALLAATSNISFLLPGGSGCVELYMSSRLSDAMSL